jgi:hypothetical protein
MMLASFTLSQMALAVSPAPGGGYPGQNTAEGEDALFSLTTGTDTTANGYTALYSNTTGNNNTASGLNALVSNNGSLNIAVGFGAGQNLTTGDNKLHKLHP